MALKQVGVEAIVKGLPSFKAGMDVINNAARQTADNLKKRIGDTSAFKGATQTIEAFSERIKGFVQQVIAGIPVIGDFSAEITAMLNPAALAAVAVAALTVAIVQLGIEGGKIKGVRASFEGLTAVYATANEALDKLREATRGTVTDFELMRVTNVALAGASQTFAKQFGEALPQVLNLARLQAQATGQDVSYLVNSLVTGIKRASPLLIDNTGIVLKVGEANETLAKKLGKSVEALTAEEKQIAVLNAVLLAGENITNQYANAQEYASVKAARTTATIQNAVNAIQVAVEPIASSVLDVVNLVLGNLAKIGAGIMTVLQPIIDIIATIVNAITAILAPVINFIGDLIGGVFTAIGSVVETVLAPFQILIGVLGKVGGAVVSLVITPFKWLLDFLLSAVQFIVGLARGFLKAGAALIGALTAGILHAANNTLVPAVIAVATMIADFLVGQSPPPKGPLSQIDKGGAATMEAWLGGFVGVSLDPVNEVAASVTASMGSIAQLSLDGVKERFKQLDAALFPFQDRLNIVKAQFEALKPVSEAAFSAIDRQLDTAVQALASGSEAAAAQVRTLDMQKESLQSYLDAQQESIDRAQIQYALAQAQQARERVLLSIRERQLDIDKEKDPVIKAEKEAALKKDKEKAAGAGESSAVGGVGGGGFALPKAPGDGGFVDELTGAFDTAFEQGGGSGELAKLKQGGSMISKQFERIGKGFEASPIVKGLKGIGDSITAAFDPNNPESFIFKVLQFLAEQSNPGNTNGIVGWFVNLPNALRQSVTDLAGIVDELVIKPITKAFTGAFDSSNPDSVVGLLESFFKGEGKLYEILSAPITWIKEKIVTPFNTLFNDLFNQLFNFTDPSTFAGRVALFFMGTGDGTLQGIFLGPLDWIYKNVIDPFKMWFDDLWRSLFDTENTESFGGRVKDFFMGDGTGTLRGIITSVANWLSGALSDPFRAGLNAIIGALEGFVNNGLIAALNAIANTLADLLQSIGDTGSDIYKRLREFGSIKINLPRLAGGGILSRGAFIAGERGREIGMSAKPFAMFSNRFVKAIDLFADTVAKPMPVPVLGGATYNDQSSSQSQVNNFYGVSGTDDAARRIAMLRAFK